MSRLVVRELYIFSIKERRAKFVPFMDGINVVTSSREDGTKKGKSAIMKSIYYTLGADCVFEDKWNINDKVCILKFMIDASSYFLLRYQRLFKLYTANGRHEVFRTSNREDLAEKLGTLFKFKVMLPNKTTGNIEVTPPAFNYLLNYIDQDGIEGSKFQSFASLQQYSNFKDKVLYYHFGVYTEEYYEIIKKIESLEETMQTLEKRIQVCKEMIQKVNYELQNCDYCSDLNALKGELENSKKEYIEHRNKLVKCKKNLVKYRNIREDLQASIYEIMEFSKAVSKNNIKIIKHECPYCHSEISDDVDNRIRNYNTIEDALFMKAELEENLTDLERKIQKEEEKYTEQLEMISEYEKRLDTFNEEIDDVFKYRGYIEMKDSLIKEISGLTLNMEENEKLIKIEKKKRGEFDAEKKKVNDMYYNLMMLDKEQFEIEEISENRLKDITSFISAGGSNKPIATVIWYVNLLKIKNKFNETAIKFPVVFDSPNNAETDNQKRVELLQYIFDSVDSETQLIVSMLGFEKKEFDNIEKCNVISLDNEKYNLLCEKDYEKYKELFINLMGADI